MTNCGIHWLYLSIEFRPLSTSDLDMKLNNPMAWLQPGRFGVPVHWYSSEVHFGLLWKYLMGYNPWALSMSANKRLMLNYDCYIEILETLLLRATKRAQVRLRICLQIIHIWHLREFKWILFICLVQNGAIPTLNGKPLKLVDAFIYFLSSRLGL